MMSLSLMALCLLPSATESKSFGEDYGTRFKTHFKYIDIFLFAIIHTMQTTDKQYKVLTFELY